MPNCHAKPPPASSSAGITSTPTKIPSKTVASGTKGGTSKSTRRDSSDNKSVPKLPIPEKENKTQQKMEAEKEETVPEEPNEDGPSQQEAVQRGRDTGEEHADVDEQPPTPQEAAKKCHSKVSNYPDQTQSTCNPLLSLPTGSITIFVLILEGSSLFLQLQSVEIPSYFSQSLLFPIQDNMPSTSPSCSSQHPQHHQHQQQVSFDRQRTHTVMTVEQNVRAGIDAYLGTMGRGTGKPRSIVRPMPQQRHKDGEEQNRGGEGKK